LWSDHDIAGPHRIINKGKLDIKRRIAQEKHDEHLLTRIRGVDLFACEAQYHPSCRNKYSQNPEKWRSRDEDSKEQQSHTEVFQLPFTLIFFLPSFSQYIQSGLNIILSGSRDLRRLLSKSLLPAMDGGELAVLANDSGSL
jgi:hypothetical protein